MTPAAIVAQVLPVDVPKVTPAIWDFLLVGGVIVALTAIIFVVTAFSKRQRTRRRKSRHGPEILRNSEEHLRQQNELPDEEAEPAEYSKRRRRKRDHRPRNPTLAERGGLPPTRDPNTSPHSGL